MREEKETQVKLWGWEEGADIVQLASAGSIPMQGCGVDARIPA